MSPGTARPALPVSISSRLSPALITQAPSAWASAQLGKLSEAAPHARACHIPVYLPTAPLSCPTAGQPRVQGAWGGGWGLPLLDGGA